MGQQSTVAGYGDLVVLVNPAFEAMLFDSLSDMSIERGSYFPHQLPVLAVLTSKADDATRRAFPAGRWLSTLFEKTHVMQRHNGTTNVSEEVDGDAANITAVGHFESYRTHRLDPSDARKREDFTAMGTQQTYNLFEQTSGGWAEDEPGSNIQFSGVTLRRLMTSAGRNPYIVAYVNKELIRNHNDIDDDRSLLSSLS